MKTLLSFTLVLITFVAPAQNKINDKTLKEFDQYVDRVKKEWNVPGLAITVVKDGKVIFKKGYGVRELGKPETVDTQTLFACASTTKAMTVAVLGMLVDQGKVDWDDPVTKYIPELRLYDPFVTLELRVRDLLTHNTGVGSTDYFWFIMNISPDEMIHRLSYVKPSYSFRRGFEYQNTMYNIAGRVIERITGKPWAENMTKMLFEPLGMMQTVPQRSISSSTNMTKPHFSANDTIKALDFGRESVGAAGAVWSNVEDMGIWIKTLLDSSKYGGGRLLKPETFHEIFKPQVTVPENDYPVFSILKPNWVTYGLGWYQIDYKGKKVNFHTGSLLGLTAIIGLIPEENIGVYVFGNYDHAEVRHALLYKTFDYFALGGNRDWNGEFKILYSKLKLESKKAVQDFESSRVPGTRMSLSPEAYAGTYTSDLYGKVEVTAVGNNMKFNINDKTVEEILPHWHYDTFYGPVGKAKEYSLDATFLLDATGKPSMVNISGMEFAREE